MDIATTGGKCMQKQQPKRKGIIETLRYLYESDAPRRTAFAMACSPSTS